ncbi:MAG TPA: hypothetical protein VFX25_12820 [Streptosporangiaceae bacterium]|nr:hypothetical protein [Streptosporangiaceae bacterium]
MLPPQLNAALYGVLAKLPGVSFDKSVTDASGRTDAGFSTVQEGYLKEEIMVSPSTFAYLGLEEVAVVNHTTNATDGIFRIVKGQVLGWTAVCWRPASSTRRASARSPLAARPGPASKVPAALCEGGRPGRPAPGRPAGCRW